MNCPKCNTPNSESARWCALCLEKFEPRPTVAYAPPAPAPYQQPIAPPAPAPYQQPIAPPPAATAALIPPSPAPASQPLRKVGEQLVWTCPSCSTETSFDQNNCSACGASLYDIFRNPVETHRPQDQNPNIAAVLSLVPGGGHFYLGRIAQGIIRLTLGAWWLLSAVLISGGNKLLDLIQYMFWISFIGLVVVSALDARALADDPNATQLLTGKIVRYAALILAAAAVFGLLTALVARR